MYLTLFIFRYVCGPEACHRIFGFDIDHRSVPVERLSFHLPNQKSVSFKETDNLKKVCERAEQKIQSWKLFLNSVNMILMPDNIHIKKFQSIMSGIQRTQLG